MSFPNYDYVETIDKDTPPNPSEHGDGWEYWGDHITPEARVAIWRKVIQDE